MGRLREAHATRCNEGDPEEPENRLPGEVRQHFKTSKREKQWVLCCCIC